ncbi:lytic murein transglycosylase B [Halomonas daqiaonensis]|uniref:Membrane-bound lytic murein transglycosylase B n=1 Tax=Halomonas daqiaonensis TaxID=650850 RepID=A0A1H7KGP4_9GAMM|nr:lytic murein transglycosylase B [Halomonas daqiaonensis]SEK85959.1 membrane-bound lytic murein transglycosylase B [Halomonas daqiaonensis]
MTVTRFHRSRALAAIAGVGLSLLTLTAAAADFDPHQHEGSRSLVDELVDQGIDRDWLERAMGEAVYRQGVLDAMAGAAEHRLTWHEYRAIFLDAPRIANGVAFIEAHQPAFARAEDEYGVPPEVIAAIIGVETRYGGVTGNHRVLDSLSTLAFHHPRRGRFFRGELAAFLEIAHEQQRSPGSLTGSYAGAMGYPQFIPTSYRAYAVDFDDDGLRDLWTNPVDAIGSVANYFAEHGWRPGEPVYHEAEGPASPPEGVAFNHTRPPEATVAELSAAGIEPRMALDADLKVVPLVLEQAGGESNYRLARYNFYVITRYNHSHLYAMAVTELAEAIAEARGLEPHWLDATDTASEEAP